MKIPFSFFFLLFYLSPLPGQSDRCGTDLSRLSENEQAAAAALAVRTRQPAARSNDVDSVAVTIHIMEVLTQGDIDFTLADVEAEIAKANRVFANAGICLFICGSPRYISGSSVYNFGTGDELNRELYVPNTINIYFVNDLQNSAGQGLCGYANFPFRGDEEDRYVMMNKLCATDGGTLIHELGHFYGLFHTHETTFGRELVDGSNCWSAGDRLCDTPADPNLGSPNLMSGCTYIGTATDAQGSSYTPPVTNFMSYAPSNCQYYFSEDQLRIIADVQQNENAYLSNNCDFYPDFSILRQQDRFKIRSDQNIAVRYTLRSLDANQGYNLKLKISFSENPDKVGMILHEERLILQSGKSTSELDFDLALPKFRGTGTYYLKAFIDADNEVIERTEKNNIALITVEVDNSQFGEAVLFPNPAQEELKVFIRDRSALRNYRIRIFRPDGRLMWEDQGYKLEEEFFELIDVSWLPQGIYLLTVDFEAGVDDYAFKFLKK